MWETQSHLIWHLTAWEISRVLSQCDPVANGMDLSLLEPVIPIERG